MSTVQQAALSLEQGNCCYIYIYMKRAVAKSVTVVRV